MELQDKIALLSEDSISEANTALLSQDSSPVIRTLLAEHSSVSNEVLNTMLRNEKDKEVATAILSNKNGYDLLYSLRFDPAVDWDHYDFEDEVDFTFQQFKQAEGRLLGENIMGVDNMISDLLSDMIKSPLLTAEQLQSIDCSQDNTLKIEIHSHPNYPKDKAFSIDDAFSDIQARLLNARNVTKEFFDKYNMGKFGAQAVNDIMTNTTLSTSHGLDALSKIADKMKENLGDAGSEVRQDAKDIRNALYSVGRARVFLWSAVARGDAEDMRSELENKVRELAESVQLGEEHRYDLDSIVSVISETAKEAQASRDIDREKGLSHAVDPASDLHYSENLTVQKR